MAISYDGVLLTAAALTGTQTGSWFQVDTEKTHLPILVDLSAGTATITVEGRISPSDPNPVSLAVSTAREGLVVAAFPQMRVKVSGATAADVRVAIGSIVVS